MIRNETPLETIFYNMLDELKNDFQTGELYGKDGRYLKLAGQINLSEVYRFMHNAPTADNPNGICQFALSEQGYIDENHQEEMQELCDLYAKDGFKFEVTLNPMSLLWTKDGKVIDRDNFDEINDALQTNSNMRKMR